MTTAQQAYSQGVDSIEGRQSAVDFFKNEDERMRAMMAAQERRRQAAEAAGRRSADNEPGIASWLRQRKEKARDTHFSSLRKL